MTEPSEIARLTFTLAAELDAQDIFLIEGECPVFKISGSLRKQMRLPVWTKEVFDTIIHLLFRADKKTPVEGYFEDILRRIGKAEGEGTTFSSHDFNSVHGSSNLRCHMYTTHPKGSADGKSMRSTQLVMNIRVIPQEIPTVEQLNLPDISPIFKHTGGILLISGRAGDGKSTTAAAIINEFNHMQDKTRIILTIEEPVEFVHANNNALIMQKRIGDNVATYARATEDVLREDADIVMLGELRKEAEMRNVIRLAEVGKLVVASIHSTSVPDTIERYLSEFSGEDKEQIRTRLLSNLCGIIHQNLVVKDDEQFPLVSMCLVDSEQTALDLRGLHSRAEFEEYLNNSTSPAILSREDGFRYLCSLGVLTQDEADQYISK